MRTLLLLLFLGCSLPNFAQPQQEVKKQIDSLMFFIKNKGTESFAENTVYRGQDTKRKWKDVHDPSNPEELKAAKEFMQTLSKALQGCNYKEFDTFQQKQESESTWYVYTYTCGANKKIHLAFLKIEGKYVLGDIDVEDTDDE